MASCSSFNFFIRTLVLSCIVVPALGGGLLTQVVAPMWHALEDKLDLEYDDVRALDIKSEDFWQPVHKAAENVKPNQHADLYKDAAALLAELPANNSYVHDSLQEAVAELQHADALTEQASATLLSAERMAAGKKTLPPLTSTEKFLSLATMVVRRWMGLSYKDRLHEQIEHRRAEVLPSLRGANRVTGDVLKDIRQASNKAFDVLKYDIYERDAPKTPEAAKRVAHRVIDAARETRQSFFQPILRSVDGLARDARGENELPKATVDEALATEDTTSSHTEV